MDGMTAVCGGQNPIDHAVEPRGEFAYPGVIAKICNLRWETLTNDDLLQVAHAYYYFSVQFRENLEIAIRLRPLDAKLRELHRGECDTANLSPWPGVADPGERLDHDEFMRRLLALEALPGAARVRALGERYLNGARAIDDLARATSIASYEDGGLSRVFSAMLRAPDWRGPGQQAFRFFLEQHISFDTDDDGGHGELSRHLVPTDNILPLWSAFAELLTASAPRLLPPISGVHLLQDAGATD